ncbi:MAG TPA: Gfo/Idh/MocA family oxidoreductase [Caulobacteraceae bacterium]|jgi:D-galactose 1-dehydrogenase
MTSEKIDLAIIGMGKIARDQHAPALARSLAFNLVATVDPQGGLPDLRCFETLEGMIAEGIRPRAVSICTPPQVRGDLARKSLALGFDVMLEKPPAATLAEFADLKRHAARAGAVLFATWHSRYAPMVAQARAWLADRTVAGGRVTWREDVRRWHPGQEWLWAPGGLGVFDPAINAFSILTEILPAPPRVRAARFDTPSNRQTPIAAQLELVCAAADIAVDLDFLQTGPQTWEIALDTECGHRLRLLDGGARMAIDDEPPRSAPVAEYDGLYAHFAELIAARASDADASPLRLVADAFMLAETRLVDAFSY